MTAPVYRDRQSGAIKSERVFGERALPYLYQTRRGRFLVDKILSRPLFSHFYGLIQRSRLSRKKIRPFAETLGIDVSESEHPLEHYESLDAFFSRRLKRGARPVATSWRAFLSPADGRVTAIEKLDGQRLHIKRAEVTVAELIGDRQLAERFRGGVAFNVRLTPADCHRFHFPASGMARPTRLVRGRLHSVHPIATAAGAPALKNKRTVSLLEAGRFGSVMLVEVGALVAGSLVQTHSPGPVVRGDEKGYFRFGGSTIVVVLEPNRIRIDDDLLRDSKQGLETLVRAGTQIGELI